MKAVVGAISLITQATGFLAIGWMFYDLFTLPDALFEQAGDDTQVIVDAIVDTIASYRPITGAGIVAAFVTWLLILKGRYASSWFLVPARVFAWMWMPLIPVGTIVGVLVLSARSAVLKDR